MPNEIASKECPNYAVVVPVLDEAGNIQPLVDEIRATMTGISGESGYEIIYVNDGSKDATAAELEAASKSCPTLRAFHHATAAGQSQSLITGVKQTRANWIITLDGDGQNDPADIPKLIQARDDAVAKEPGYAETFLYIGHRRRRYDSLARRYQSWLANDIRGWILGDHTPDSGCGLKLFRRDVFLDLPQFNALHRFIPALVIRAGGRAVSVDVSHRPRAFGQSKYGFWRRLAVGVVDLLGVLWLIARNTRPDTIKQKDVS